jgi:intracellular multiplication protein IcmV
MGFFSSSKKVAGHIVNFKVADWVDTGYHKNIFNYISNTTKSLFVPEQTTTQETFEQAMQRLNITTEDLAKRKQEFSRLFFIFLIISLLFFSYTMFITIKYRNIFSFILGLSVTTLSLSKTFRYHFWLTQINKKKLGLTFKEWIDQ